MYAPYRYTPLSDPSHIRVLDLLDVTPTLIKCRLHETTPSAGTYQALSYVWGDPAHPHHALLVDDRDRPLGTLPLTPNLHAALRDLWHAPEVPSKCFWIDQLCIDQASSEKAAQVAMMGRIYAAAARVITYVGPAHPDPAVEARGLAQLADLDAHYAPLRDTIAHPADTFRIAAAVRGEGAWVLPDHLRGPADADPAARWRWLADLAFGPWCARLWLAQEQVLNAAVAMLRGPRVLGWDAVATATVLFTYGVLPSAVAAAGLRARCGGRLGLLCVGSPVVRAWLDRRLGRAGRGPMEPLLANLRAYERLECADPRDRVFGLLAMSTDVERLGIRVDYAVPAPALFQDVSVRLLRGAETLHLLADICRWDQSDPNRPSWAFSAPRPPGTVGLRMPPAIHIWGKRAAHPIPTLRAPLRFDRDGRVLIVRGRVVDEVQMCTPPAYVDDDLYDEAKAVVVNWSRVLLSRPITSETGLALARASILQHGVAGVPSEKELLFGFWSYFRVIPIVPGRGSIGCEDMEACEQAIGGLAATVLDPEDLRTSYTDPDVQPPSKVWAAGKTVGAALVWKGRSFGLTTGGRVFSTMNHVQEGDVIVALEGSPDQLWTLRRVGKQYRLVGDTWVDGMMMGEAYEALNPDDVDGDIEIV